MQVHIFVIESEKPKSPTSVREIYIKIRKTLATAGVLGQSVFLDAPTKGNLIDNAKTFSTWIKTIPSSDPVVLWLSIHGKDPEPNVPDDKRTLVGTSGVSAAKEEVNWEDLFTAAKRAQEPGRLLVLMDVCWGSSPTVPRHLTLPQASRPAMVFGPIRKAMRNELDAASIAVFDGFKKSGIPSVAAAKIIVDSLNSKFKPKPGTIALFYRVWWWDVSGIKLHPTSTPKVKPKH